MVRKRNKDALVSDFDPILDNIFDYVKNYRAMTGKRLNLLENYLVPKKEADTMYRENEYGEPVFNLSTDQLDWAYPDSAKMNWDYEKSYDKDFTEIDAQFLDDLIPVVEPGDDYFEEEELPILYAQDTPLSSAPINYISKFFLIDVKFNYKDNTGHRGLLLYSLISLEHDHIIAKDTKLLFSMMLTSRKWSESLLKV